MAKVWPYSLERVRTGARELGSPTSSSTPPWSLRVCEWRRGVQRRRRGEGEGGQRENICGLRLRNVIGAVC